MADKGLLTPDSPTEAGEIQEKLTIEERSLPVQVNEEKREKWGSKCEFLLSIIGFAVDLANVWRFPYYCYKNGGGAFLIPYFTMLCLGAVPLFYMELLLGQYHKQGAISLWRIAPIFKGVGFTIATVSLLVSFYYNTIIAWSFYYFFASFTSQLPWTTCDNEWNTCNCWAGGRLPSNISNFTIECIRGGNLTNIKVQSKDLIGSQREYFERGVLRVHESEGLGDLGPANWDMALCEVLAYTVIYFATWKGVKSSGKVVYVTAIMPYVILTILFVRGLFLEGATDGLKYFIEPRLDRLADSEVWIDAAVQVFYSVGAGFGVHLAMASYNDIKNNCFIDCLVTAGVNSLTSLFSGCTVFIYLGYMSVYMGQSIETVASQGPSLVFEVYPQAISTLPGSTAWSLLFFFMVIMLGMDSSMGGIESIATGIIDEFGSRIKKYRFHREIVLAMILSVSFLFALPGVTKGGLFYVTFMDTFAAGTSLILVVFFEAVAVAWMYGLEQFCKDAKLMLGFTPGIYWRLCWKFISPTFLFGIVICSIVTFSPLTTDLSTRKVEYPPWTTAIGWLMVFCTFLWVPSLAIYTLFFKYEYAHSIITFTRTLSFAITPESEHRQILDGHYPKRLNLRHWLDIGLKRYWRSNTPMAEQLNVINESANNMTENGYLDPTV